MEEKRTGWGIVAATIANCAPFRSENSKSLSPLDFYPDDRREPERQTPEEQEAMLRAFFGKFKKKN